MAEIKLGSVFQLAYAENGFVVRAWIGCDTDRDDSGEVITVGRTKTYVCGTDREVREMLDKVLINLNKYEPQIEGETGMKVKL